MRGWLQVYKKELREFARDRRILMSAFLGPVLLEVFLIALLGFVGEAVGGNQSQKILIENRREAGPFLEVLEKSKKFEIKDLPAGKDAEKALADKDGRLVLKFPSGFTEQVAKGKAPAVTALVDPTEPTSDIAFGAVNAAIAPAIQKYMADQMSARNLTPQAFTPYRIERVEAKVNKPLAGEFLISFLPYLIVIWAFYGGFSIVGDLVAGEKERGSLETLLIAPISRKAIAIGKFMALATVSLASCCSAIMGVVIMGVLNLPLTQKLFEDGLNIAPLSTFAIFVTVIPLVVFFSGTLLAISTYSRNQREVQSYLSLLSFVVLMPAVFSQFIGFTDIGSSKWIPFVPVLNTATVIREALLNKLNWYNLGVTATVSIVLAIACLWIAIKMFSKEKVLMRV